MNLSEFKSILKANVSKRFRLQLPDGSPVPASFHVTEVGLVEKTFIDCGGTRRATATCQLQVWVGQDEGHRLEAGKMVAILGKAEPFLRDGSLPVEIEYEEGVISQFPVEGHRLDGDSVVLILGRKHTDCLARDVCGGSEAGVAGPAAACCGAGRC